MYGFKKLIKRIAIYFLLVLAAFLLQTCVFPLLKFFYAAPNLLLIVTFSYGFIYGSLTGMICGIFAGFLMDVFYYEPFGMFILIFCYLGFFSGLFQNQLKNDSIVFPLILCLLNELFYNAAVMVYRLFNLGHADVAYSIKNVVLPELIFTLLITILAYRILLHTNRKLDKIDDVRGQNVA